MVLYVALHLNVRRRIQCFKGFVLQFNPAVAAGSPRASGECQDTRRSNGRCATAICGQSRTRVKGIKDAPRNLDTVRGPIAAMRRAPATNAQPGFKRRATSRTHLADLRRCECGRRRGTQRRRNACPRTGSDRSRRRGGIQAADSAPGRRCSISASGGGRTAGPLSKIASCYIRLDYSQGIVEA